MNGEDSRVHGPTRGPQATFGCEKQESSRRSGHSVQEPTDLHPVLAGRAPDPTRTEVGEEELLQAVRGLAFPEQRQEEIACRP